MNIHDYLSAKYQTKTPTTMTSVEAKFFEIPYPLQAGWLAKHGSREVTQHAYFSINTALERREEKKAKGKHGKVTKPSKAKRIYKAPAIAPKILSLDAATTDSFLMSFEWRKLRMVILKKFGAKCQCCGATPADGARMNVDHIKPRKLFPSLALVESNLQVLCGECNHGKGNWDQTDWRNANNERAKK